MKKRETGMPTLMNALADQIANLDWDAGDQGREDGFGLKHKGHNFQILIEGWDEDCAAGARGNLFEALSDLSEEWRQDQEERGFRTWSFEGSLVPIVTVGMREVDALEDLDTLEL